MPWVPRGLRDGIVTSRYPARPDGYGTGFSGAVVVHHVDRVPASIAEAAEVCPTEAIAVEHGRPRLDRGRCILCGRCARAYPDVFRIDAGVETASVHRSALVVPTTEADDAVDQVRSELHRKVRALRRSVHIRHVDAGSDGADEWEVAALTNPVYDIQRLGVFFTASPRHADVLLATGVGAAGMLGALWETYDVMPSPKVVIAAGTDAVGGGLIGEGYASRGGLTDVLPVDVFVPGSPPTPFGLLFAILLAIGRLPRPLGGSPRRDRPAGAVGADALRRSTEERPGKGGDR